MACPHSACSLHPSAPLSHPLSPLPSNPSHHRQAYSPYPTPHRCARYLPVTLRRIVPGHSAAPPLRPCLRIEGEQPAMSESTRFAETDKADIGSQRHPSQPIHTQRPVQTDTPKLRPSPHPAPPPTCTFPLTSPPPSPHPPLSLSDRGRFSGPRKFCGSMLSLREDRHPHPRNLCVLSLRSFFLR